MSELKQYVSSASTLQEALATLAKLPGIFNAAFGRWHKVQIIVKEAEEKRSLDQNSLQWKWCSEASRQGDMNAIDYQAFCKLHFGIPILRRDSKEYREVYDRILRSLPYEQKLELMKPPFDWPVTRGMTKKQKTEYLDACWQHFTGLGFRLTDPNLLGMDDWREAA